MKDVVITYLDGSVEKLYAEWVPVPRDGMLTIPDVNGQLNKSRHIPLASIKHYEVSR